jgi:hypothetical protein
MDTRKGFQPQITVMSAMRSIKDRSFLLPAIQRRFVWSSGKVEALFDSLMLGYPINSFMLWKITSPKVKQSVRFYDFLQYFRQHFHEQNEEFSTHGHKDFHAVIDGQQRLTALYLGLFGSYAYKLPRVWLKDSEENLPTRHLYLNLVVRRPNDDEQGMVYDFRFLTKAGIEAKGPNSAWFKVGDIVNFDTPEKLAEHIDEHGPSDKEARKTLRMLREVVHQVESINYYVETDQDIDRVLDIFIRTNSGGVPLGYSDLLMSYTTAQWKNRDARAEFDTLVARVFKVGTPGFQISKDFILKTCLTLFSGDVRFKLANLNRSVIDAMAENWDRVAKAILATFEFLADLGFNDVTLRAKNPVIPIIQYVYLRGVEADFAKPQTYSEEKAAIRTWLCMSILKGVFRSQTDHLLNQLKKIVQQRAADSTPHFPLEEIRATFRHSPRSLDFDDSFVEQMLGTAIGEPEAFTLLTLLYSHLDYSRQRIDIDHLHPSAAIERIRALPIEERPIDWAFMTNEANYDSVANLQPLNDSLNRSKQDQPLADWVTERKIDRTAYLLPQDVGLDIASFKPFIEARRVLLTKRLREVVGVAPMTTSGEGAASTGASPEGQTGDS